MTSTLRVGTSDPVFMQWMGSDNLAPRPDERRAFLALDLDTFCAWLAAVDEQDRATFMLGTAWLREELG
jgi:hypothetical protein